MLGNKMMDAWFKVDIKKNKISFYGLMIFGLALIVAGLLFISETASIFFLTRSNAGLYPLCFVICVLSIGIMFIGGMLILRVMKK